MRTLYRISLGFLIVGAALTAVVSRPGVTQYEYWRESVWIGMVVATLGRVILGGRPKHAIGRLFLIVGLAASLQLVAGGYATLGTNLDLPGGALSAWLANLLRLSAVFAMMFLFHLFPTGRLLGPRWRWVALAALIGFGMHLGGLAFGQGPLEDFPAVDNPLGVLDASALDAVASLLLVVFLLGGGLLSLAIRLRRSGGLERQQLKWFVYASFVAVAGLTLLNVLFPQQMESRLGFYPWLLLPTSVLAAVALAILRYRLYDIDLVINRTLVYGSLTVLLGAVYVAGVVGLPSLLPLAEDNDLLVAGSTLAVAALFAPLRRRIQAFVDRRFYRRRYDAQRTMEVFSARLREQVDLDDLVENLASVVRETLQPASVRVWLTASSLPLRGRVREGARR